MGGGGGEAEEEEEGGGEGEEGFQMDLSRYCNRSGLRCAETNTG